jgi:hypothetical protein
VIFLRSPQKEEEYRINSAEEQVLLFLNYPLLLKTRLTPEQHFIIWPARRSIPGERNMAEAQQSDALKNLVQFIVCLAIIGTIVALAWYFAVDLPLQQAAALQVPPNTSCYPYCIGN